MPDLLSGCCYFTAWRPTKDPHSQFGQFNEPSSTTSMNGWMNRRLDKWINNQWINDPYIYQSINLLSLEGRIQTLHTWASLQSLGRLWYPWSRMSPSRTMDKETHKKKKSLKDRPVLFILTLSLSLIFPFLSKPLLHYHQSNWGQRCKMIFQLFDRDFQELEQIGLLGC